MFIYGVSVCGTLRAKRSLSKLWPIRIDSALNMFSKTACTSLSLMVALSRSSSVTPENLNTHRVNILYHFA